MGRDIAKKWVQYPLSPMHAMATTLTCTTSSTVLTMFEEKCCDLVVLNRSPGVDTVEQSSVLFRHFVHVGTVTYEPLHHLQVSVSDRVADLEPFEQECIPVGCLPPARYRTGVSVWGSP